jgi:phosphoenolpyruvate carboxykinase (ATP)
MHCSANIGPEGDTAVFFGLSGTGKTTLSADASRRLIGDDEHGWSDRGVFNFEGGCYAQVIRLRAETEPEIYAATQRFGTVLENVVLDPATRAVDFDADRITENTRACYPIDYIPNFQPSGAGGHPRNIVFLTADDPGLPACLALTTTHELGHALGIFQHSDEPSDLMYASPTVPGPSERDLETAEHIYHVPANLEAVRGAP